MSIKTAGPSQIDILMDIHWDSTGKPHFTYEEQLPWVHADGTLDMGTASSNVEITITLVSDGGEAFASPTIAIEHYNGHPPAQCPAADDNGQGVFSKLRVSNKNRSFTLTDRNEGKAQFFYALWFEKAGMEPFAWDPIIINKTA